MSDFKISQLVSEVSRELDIDIPDSERQAIMIKVKSLVESKLNIPQLLNDSDEEFSEHSDNVSNDEESMNTDTEDSKSSTVNTNDTGHNPDSADDTTNTREFSRASTVDTINTECSHASTVDTVGTEYSQASTDIYDEDQSTTDNLEEDQQLNSQSSTNIYPYEDGEIISLDTTSDDNSNDNELESTSNDSEDQDRNEDNKLIRNDESAVKNDDDEEMSNDKVSDNDCFDNELDGYDDEIVRNDDDEVVCSDVETDDEMLQYLNKGPIVKVDKETKEEKSMKTKSLKMKFLILKQKCELLESNAGVDKMLGFVNRERCGKNMPPKANELKKGTDKLDSEHTTGINQTKDCNVNNRQDSILSKCSFKVTGSSEKEVNVDINSEKRTLGSPGKKKSTKVSLQTSFLYKEQENEKARNIASFVGSIGKNNEVLLTKVDDHRSPAVYKQGANSMEKVQLKAEPDASHKKVIEIIEGEENAIKTVFTKGKGLKKGHKRTLGSTDASYKDNTDIKKSKVSSEAVHYGQSLRLAVKASTEKIEKTDEDIVKEFEQASGIRMQNLQINVRDCEEKSDFEFKDKDFNMMGMETLINKQQEDIHKRDWNVSKMILSKLNRMPKAPTVNISDYEIEIVGSNDDNNLDFAGANLGEHIINPVTGDIEFMPHILNPVTGDIEVDDGQRWVSSRATDKVKILERNLGDKIQYKVADKLELEKLEGGNEKSINSGLNDKGSVDVKIDDTEQKQEKGRSYSGVMKIAEVVENTNKPTDKINQDKFISADTDDAVIKLHKALEETEIYIDITEDTSEPMIEEARQLYADQLKQRKHEIYMDIKGNVEKAMKFAARLRKVETAGIVYETEDGKKEEMTANVFEAMKSKILVDMKRNINRVINEVDSLPKKSGLNKLSIKNGIRAVGEKVRKNLIEILIDKKKLRSPSSARVTIKPQFSKIKKYNEEVARVKRMFEPFELGNKKLKSSKTASKTSGQGFNLKSKVAEWKSAKIAVEEKKRKKEIEMKRFVELAERTWKEKQKNKDTEAIERKRKKEQELYELMQKEAIKQQEINRREKNRLWQQDEKDEMEKMRQQYQERKNELRVLREKQAMMKAEKDKSEDHRAKVIRNELKIAEGRKLLETMEKKKSDAIVQVDPSEFRLIERQLENIEHNKYVITREPRAKVKIEPPDDVEVAVENVDFGHNPYTFKANEQQRIEKPVTLLTKIKTEPGLEAEQPCEGIKQKEVQPVSQTVKNKVKEKNLQLNQFPQLPPKIHYKRTPTPPPQEQLQVLSHLFPSSQTSFVQQLAGSKKSHVSYQRNPTPPPFPKPNRFLHKEANITRPPAVVGGIPSVSKGVPSVSRDVPSVSRGVPSVIGGVPSFPGGVHVASIGFPSVNRGVPAVVRGVPSVAGGMHVASVSVPSSAVPPNTDPNALIDILAQQLRLQIEAANRLAEQSDTSLVDTTAFGSQLQAIFNLPFQGTNLPQTKSVSANTIATTATSIQSTATTQSQDIQQAAMSTETNHLKTVTPNAVESSSAILKGLAIKVKAGLTEPIHASQPKPYFTSPIHSGSASSTDENLPVFAQLMDPTSDKVSTTKPKKCRTASTSSQSTSVGNNIVNSNIATFATTLPLSSSTLTTSQAATSLSLPISGSSNQPSSSIKVEVVDLTSSTTDMSAVQKKYCGRTPTPPPSTSDSEASDGSCVSLTTSISNLPTKPAFILPRPQKIPVQIAKLVPVGEPETPTNVQKASTMNLVSIDSQAAQKTPQTLGICLTSPTAIPQAQIPTQASIFIQQQPMSLQSTILQQPITLQQQAAVQLPMTIPRDAMEAIHLYQQRPVSSTTPGLQTNILQVSRLPAVQGSQPMMLVAPQQPLQAPLQIMTSGAIQTTTPGPAQYQILSQQPSSPFVSIVSLPSAASDITNTGPISVAGATSTQPLTQKHIPRILGNQDELRSLFLPKPQKPPVDLTKIKPGTTVVLATPSQGPTKPVSYQFICDGVRQIKQEPVSPTHSNQLEVGSDQSTLIKNESAALDNQSTVLLSEILANQSKSAMSNESCDLQPFTSILTTVNDALIGPNSDLDNESSIPSDDTTEDADSDTGSLPKILNCFSLQDIDMTKLHHDFATLGKTDATAGSEKEEKMDKLKGLLRNIFHDKKVVDQESVLKQLLGHLDGKEPVMVPSNPLKVSEMKKEKKENNAVNLPLIDYRKQQLKEVLNTLNLDSKYKKTLQANLSELIEKGPNLEKMWHPTLESSFEKQLVLVKDDQKDGPKSTNSNPAFVPGTISSVNADPKLPVNPTGGSGIAAPCGSGIAAPCGSGIAAPLPVETLNTVFMQAMGKVNVRLSEKAETMIMKHLDHLTKDDKNQSTKRSVSDIKLLIHKELGSGLTTVKPTLPNPNFPVPNAREIAEASLSSYDSRHYANASEVPPPEVVKSYAGIREYKCRVCPKVFDKRYSYFRHEKTHVKYNKVLINNKEKEFVIKCPNCAAEFQRRHLFKVHYKVKHCEAGADVPLWLQHWKADEGDEMAAQDQKDPVGGTVSMWGCGACGLGCQNQSHLENHLVCHSGYCKFVCRSCGCGFNTDAMKKRHDQLHTIGEKDSPFICSMCGNFFWFKQALQIHYSRDHSVKDGFDLDHVIDAAHADANAVENQNQTIKLIFAVTDRKRAIAEKLMELESELSGRKDRVGSQPIHRSKPVTASDLSGLKLQQDGNKISQSNRSGVTASDEDVTRKKKEMTGAPVLSVGNMLNDVIDKVWDRNDRGIDIENRKSKAETMASSEAILDMNKRIARLPKYISKNNKAASKTATTNVNNQNTIPKTAVATKEKITDEDYVAIRKALTNTDYWEAIARQKFDKATPRAIPNNGNAGTKEAMSNIDTGNTKGVIDLGKKGAMSNIEDDELMDFKIEENIDSDSAEDCENDETAEIDVEGMDKTGFMKREKNKLYNYLDSRIGGHKQTSEKRNNQESIGHTIDIGAMNNVNNVQLGETCTESVNNAPVFQLVSDVDFLSQIGSFDEIRNSLNMKQTTVQDSEDSSDEIDERNENGKRTYSALEVLEHPDKFPKLTNVAVKMDRIPCASTRNDNRDFKFVF